MKVVVVSVLMVSVVACAGNIRPGRQIDDALLAWQVQEALAQDTALRAYDITVNASGGAVTLLGLVRTTAERERATVVARSVSGVKSVENLLSVR